MTNIVTPRHTLRVPIPVEVDQEGGLFEVLLSELTIFYSWSVDFADFVVVSVEDSSGCKRPINIPGISVNVRRIKVRQIIFINVLG